MLNKLTLFYKKTPQQRALLIEAFIFLGISRIVLMTVKFKNIAWYLRKRIVKPTPKTEESQLMEAKKMGMAIVTMSRHTFWKSQCLVQAIAAKLILNRRGINSTLYLGITRDEAGNLIAHAWIDAYGVILTGTQCVEQYIVISAFGG